MEISRILRRKGNTQRPPESTLGAARAPFLQRPSPSALHTQFSHAVSSQSRTGVGWKGHGTRTLEATVSCSLACFKPWGHSSPQAQMHLPRVLGHTGDLRRPLPCRPSALYRWTVHPSSAPLRAHHPAQPGFPAGCGAAPHLHPAGALGVGGAPASRTLPPRPHPRSPRPSAGDRGTCSAPVSPAVTSQATPGHRRALLLIRKLGSRWAPPGPRGRRAEEGGSCAPRPPRPPRPSSPSPEAPRARQRRVTRAPRCSRGCGSSWPRSSQVRPGGLGRRGRWVGDGPRGTERAGTGAAGV